MTKSFQIKVPGSTANLGPGFDSIGVGLSLYLTIRVHTSNKWKFVHIGPNVPTDTTPENHLLFQIAQDIAARFNKTLPPCLIEMESELPLARGLGSSAAAIVAAIELANILCDLQLTTQDKLNLSSQIEGHPDNACASVLGGITISAMKDGIVDTIHLQTFEPSFIVMIPDFELKTAEARAALPNHYDRPYTVVASANANMLTASILQGDYLRIGNYMEADYFHEPYRAKLIPQFYEIKAAAKLAGAYGTALSGAGPTLISLVPTNKTESFIQIMKDKLPTYKIILTTVDEQGIVVEDLPITTTRQ
jgi:homoserine kinase